MTASLITTKYGYKRLEHIPANLDKFYEEEYSEELLEKLLNEDEEEIKWLRGTLWNDILQIIPRGLTLLDFGCGTGHFLKFAQEKRWHVTGIEPNKTMGSYGRDINDVDISTSLHPDKRFDVITLLNVLEHVPAPDIILRELRSIMTIDGTIVVRVPNDFSLLQGIVQRKRNMEPWWIVEPDHVNYFNFESLKNLLEYTGFSVYDELGDFPMEAFLLFGKNYINNSQVGAECHKSRMEFEMSMSGKDRRELYRNLAKGGIGRNCLVFASPAPERK